MMDKQEASGAGLPGGLRGDHEPGVNYDHVGRGSGELVGTWVNNQMITKDGDVAAAAKLEAFFNRRTVQQPICHRFAHAFAISHFGRDAAVPMPNEVLVKYHGYRIDSENGPAENDKFAVVVNAENLDWDPADPQLQDCSTQCSTQWRHIGVIVPADVGRGDPPEQTYMVVSYSIIDAHIELTGAVLRQTVEEFIAEAKVLKSFLPPGAVRFVPLNMNEGGATTAAKRFYTALEGDPWGSLLEILLRLYDTADKKKDELEVSVLRSALELQEQNLPAVLGNVDALVKALLENDFETVKRDHYKKRAGEWLKLAKERFTPPVVLPYTLYQEPISLVDQLLQIFDSKDKENYGFASKSDLTRALQKSGLALDAELQATLLGEDIMVDRDDYEEKAIAWEKLHAHSMHFRGLRSGSTSRSYDGGLVIDNQG